MPLAHTQAGTRSDRGFPRASLCQQSASSESHKLPAAQSVVWLQPFCLGNHPVPTTLPSTKRTDRDIAQQRIKKKKKPCPRCKMILDHFTFCIEKPARLGNQSCLLLHQHFPRSFASSFPQQGASTLEVVGSSLLSPQSLRPSPSPLLPTPFLEGVLFIPRFVYSHSSCRTSPGPVSPGRPHLR